MPNSTRTVGIVKSVAQTEMEKTSITPLNRRRAVLKLIRSSRSPYHFESRV